MPTPGRTQVPNLGGVCGARGLTVWTPPGWALRPACCELGEVPTVSELG